MFLVLNQQIYESNQQLKNDSKIFLKIADIEAVKFWHYYIFQGLSQSL